MDIYVYCNPISTLILHYLLLLFLASSCLNTSSTVVESCIEKERQALLSFKGDLIDPSGRLASWVGHECCLWRGISCNNRTGHVATIDLYNSYPDTHLDVQQNQQKEYAKSSLGGKLNPFLLGEIPPSLGNLSNLNYLDLSSAHYLSSKNLNWLSHLSSLKYLNLGGVNLSSTGVSWLHDVNMLPSLLELHLSSCQIDGNQLPLSLPTINFTSLLVLDMSFNHINSSFPNWVFNLTSLTKLYLNGNPSIRPSFDEFVRLKFLEHLDLSGIGLKGQVPKFSGNFCELKSLRFAGNKFDGGIEEFLNGFSNCSANRMESLDFTSCWLVGKLPSSLGILKSLQHLKLNHNSLWGSIPESIFSNLSSSLKTLDLGENVFNGSISQSLGKLSQLVSLDLSYNSWEGSLTKTHFINLTRLESLYLSTYRPEPIIFNLKEWIPPFNLREIYLKNCQVGPVFPPWLQSQTKLFDLALRNVGISSAIPEEWLFKISSQIRILDLSYNQISGKLPFRFNSFPHLVHLVLSHNQFNGSIPSSICAIQSLRILALNNNQLSGQIPREWSLWSSIYVVEVSNNNLSGTIPTSMGIPSSLAILKTDNNHLSGEIPSDLQNCSSLERLSLGGNKFTGNIPSWIGCKISSLRVLQLRSNTLSGHIPHQLCSLRFLQILDLSHNSFSGTIPKCLNNLTSLIDYGHGSSWIGSTDFEVTTVTVKGRESEYLIYNAKLLTIIDFSCNGLEGEIPEEISSLVKLGTLNLSMNKLTGNIPAKIGKLQLLETLDLSQNKLSGKIPPSLASLTFLSHLNVSCNKLTGRIPSGNQLQTLDDPSIYAGNPSLCGFPLSKCSEDGYKSYNKHEPHEEDDDDEKLGFYTGMALGFVIGFCSVCGTFILNKSWRSAYFEFFDHIKQKVARPLGRVVRNK